MRSKLCRRTVVIGALAAPAVARAQSGLSQSIGLVPTRGVAEDDDRREKNRKASS